MAERPMKQPDKKSPWVTRADLQRMTNQLAEARRDDLGKLRTELMEKLATKEDVKPLLDFYDNLVLSARITEGMGKWASRIVLGLAATLIAMGVITGGFKAALGSLFLWSSPK